MVWHCGSRDHSIRIYMEGGDGAFPLGMSCNMNAPYGRDWLISWCNTEYSNEPFKKERSWQENGLMTMSKIQSA